MRQSLPTDILPVVFTVVIFGCAVYVCALNITECANTENGKYINNTRLNCSYSLIYCNDLESQYCDEIDQCDPNYNCTEVVIVAETNSTTVATTNSTTMITTTTGPPFEDVRKICRRGLTEKYKYPGNCNYYYYCLEGFLIVEQCPMGFVFTEATRACSKRTADFRGC
ncbi:hypothetical protein ACLKA6_002825 [Drosophila palustris]